MKKITCIEDVDERIDALYEQQKDREIMQMIELTWGQKKTMNKLTDQSPFPFGNHQNIPMIEVPVEFYNHFWNEVQAWNDMQVSVMEWVRENLTMLRFKNPKLKWNRH